MSSWRPRLRGCRLVLSAVSLVAGGTARGETSDPSFPHLAQNEGRYGLVVDGAPYLILGAQVNNSSAWPEILPKVWPTMEALNVNTVEIPVYWEQLEPRQGEFDYLVVDALLAQAREHHLRLVLLWFGTWKNGSNHCMPPWMKLDHEHYPNIVDADGKEVDSPSPCSEAALKANVAAFPALMRHLKEADAQHTVLMVQVENEPGAWGSVRDYSPMAQKVFESPVPAEALVEMDKPTDRPTANSQAVFGNDADEFFQVWYVARYIGQVAAAGKAVYPLPLYVNAALRDPDNPAHPPKYEVGGPNDNVFPLLEGGRAGD
jgi:beta-galactosidase GanA